MMKLTRLCEKLVAGEPVEGWVVFALTSLETLDQAIRWRASDLASRWHSLRRGRGEVSDHFSISYEPSIELTEDCARLYYVWSLSNDWQFLRSYHASDDWRWFLYIMAKEFPVPLIRVTASTEFGGIIPTTFHFIDSKNGIERIVYVACDDDEKTRMFIQDGDPLSVEDLERYKRRRIKDRFDAPYAMELVKRLGCPVDLGTFERSLGPPKLSLCTKKPIADK